MNVGLAIQYAVVALIVLTSAVVAFRKLLPNLTNRWLAAASIHFGRKRDSRVAQSLSRRLQPKQATSHSCADGCATCNACGPKKPAAARPSREEAVPLHFMPLPERGPRGE
ncbi:MAG TPA: DUF6587 family protein [Oleiagrimonas sp.]|nr:DUF6587 family protein [Oleiagrimonas sp.]